MRTPNITTAQIVAVIGSMFAVAAAFGLHVNAAERGSIVQLVTVLGPVLVAADAVIRHGRSKVAAAAISRSTNAVTFATGGSANPGGASSVVAPTGPPAGS